MDNLARDLQPRFNGLTLDSRSDAVTRTIISRKYDKLCKQQERERTVAELVRMIEGNWRGRLTTMIPQDRRPYADTQGPTFCGLSDPPRLDNPGAWNRSLVKSLLAYSKETQSKPQDALKMLFAEVDRRVAFAKSKGDQLGGRREINCTDIKNAQVAFNIKEQPVPRYTLLKEEVENRERLLAEKAAKEREEKEEKEREASQMQGLACFEGRTPRDDTEDLARRPEVGREMQLLVLPSEAPRQFGKKNEVNE